MPTISPRRYFGVDVASLCVLLEERYEGAPEGLE
jgi:hypothetical protein